MFAVEALSSEGWEVTTSGDVILVAGESAAIQVWLTVPEDAADGTVDTPPVTVRSTFDAQVEATAEDETTVEGGGRSLDLPAIRRS